LARNRLAALFADISFVAGGKRVSLPPAFL
jgi:hypothetical protein